jgi:autotransporter passenger strand-loop-strand repeat protein
MEAGTNTTVSSGGVQVVASGGTADPTVIASGGTEIVNSRGTDLGAQISGGTQIVFGVASGAGCPAARNSSAPAARPATP